jgi:hypothetical protein
VALIKLPKIRACLQRRLPLLRRPGLVPKLMRSMPYLVLQQFASTISPLVSLEPNSIKQNFVNIPEVDNQGNTVPGTGNSSGATSTTTANSTQSITSGGNGGIGNFSKCSTPQIEFGAGFDGRKETSFQPANKSELVVT